MSIIDLLLETDTEKLQVENTKDCEITRISDILGEPFILTCRPLTHEQVGHIVEVSSSNTDTKISSVVEACRIEGKRFSDKQLMDKFGVVTPKDLVHKLFLPGEVFEVYSLVNRISGYSRDAVTELKN